MFVSIKEGERDLNFSKLLMLNFYGLPALNEWCAGGFSTLTTINPNTCCSHSTLRRISPIP